MLMVVLFVIIVALYWALFATMKLSYGIVFDVSTGEYVDSAFVVLHDAQTGQEIARTVSDTRGRYYFFVQPGKYTLSVERTHFSLCDQLVCKPCAYLYGTPYRGQVITASQPSVISIPIALRQNEPDWNHENKVLVARDVAGNSVWVRWSILSVAGVMLLGNLGLFAATLDVMYGVVSVALLVWWGYFLFDHSPINGQAGSGSGSRDGYLTVLGYGDLLVKKVPLDSAGGYWTLVPPGIYKVRVYEYTDKSTEQANLVQEYDQVVVPKGVLNKLFVK